MGLFFYELLKYKSTHNPKDFQRKHLFALNAVLHSHFESLKCPVTIVVPLTTKAHAPTTEVTWRDTMKTILCIKKENTQRDRNNWM